MSGEFVGVAHRCATPKMDEPYNGAVWRCECGKQYSLLAYWMGDVHRPKPRRSQFLLPGSYRAALQEWEPSPRKLIQEWLSYDGPVDHLPDDFA